MLGVIKQTLFFFMPSNRKEFVQLFSKGMMDIILESITSMLRTWDVDNDSKREIVEIRVYKNLRNLYA